MPYETPYHLMGWLGPQAALSEFDRLQYNFTPFAIRGQRREAPSWPIWEFAKRINGGQHLPTLKQEIGDCFVAGTLIRMADGTEQPIETVCAGDWVMSPTGQPRQVVDRIVKQFTGELVTLRGKYCPRHITATADHNFVTFPGLRTAAGRTARHKDRKRDERMAWAACGSLKKTDRVLVPFVLATELSPPTFDLAGLFPYLKADVQHVWAITGATQRCRRYVQFDETLAWLLGMYLAEGGVDRSSKTQRPQRVTFSLSRQEEDLADRIITAIKAVFGVDARKCYLPSKPAVTLVRCAHAAVAGLFKHLIPGNTYAKRIPSWFYGLPENLRVACLRGWFDGDGDGKDGATRATGVSVSQGLVHDAWYLAHSCKLRPAVHTRPPRRRSRESYQVQLYGRDVPVVCSTRPAARAQQAFTDMTRFGRAVPIKTLRREHVTDIPVYCLGVEEEHAFIANGYAVHNCVSFGAAHAGMYMACYEIYRLREAEVYKPWFPPFIYGVSRLAPDCGNGRLGNSDGSLGSWGATAMMKYGVLFADDPGVPPYSGRVAKAWGSRPGPPREFYQEASDNRVGSAAKLTTVEEIREALLNYHTITIASQQGFEMQPVRYRDHHVFKPSGQWSHQMSLLAWQDDPFPAAYRLNSWGNAHGDPLNGEPPGGAWNHADDLEKELRRYDVELYALSLFDGFDAAPDFSIL